MIYLASPYSHPDPLQVKTRFLLVEQCTVSLIKKGEYVWSPIVHCHEMATKYEMPTDAQFWKNYNFDFMRKADAIYVLCIPGWRESKGVKMEIEFAAYVGVPMLYVNEFGDILDGPNN